MANQFLALALFIMLLSFFIILNAMSNFEEVKSRPVINSISLAFSKKEPPEDNAPIEIEDPIEAMVEGDTLDQLEELFRSQVTGVEVKKNRLGTTMHLRMPIERFESGLKNISTNAPSGKKSFAPVLVSLLNNSESKIPYRMDVVLNLGQSPSQKVNDDPEDARLKAQKTASYALQLENLGLPKKLLTAGLGQAKNNTIDLYFRRYEPFSPVQAPEGEAEQ